MEQIIPFFGRFHPLLVHLPIGILLAGILFHWLSHLKTFESLKPSVHLLYLLGALGAIFSCLTGYLLSLSGEYEGAMLTQHQWLGIGVALCSSAIYVCCRITTQPKLSLLLSTMLLLTLSGAGHLGGSLTHGSDYLITHMPQPFKSWFGGEELEEVFITDVQEAIVYQDIVVPILREKCYNCHNQSKQKGKLRLDSPEHIDKGGKSGATVLKAGFPLESELVQRLLLPKNDDKHMPPKEKKQLSEAEIELLQWWIAEGADYEQAVKHLEQPDDVQPFLKALQAGSISLKETVIASVYPKVELKSPDAKTIEELQAIRVVVLPISQKSHLLSINFLNVENIQTALEKLQAVKKHIAWLKLSDSDVQDEHLSLLSEMPNLTKLYLDGTSVSNTTLTYLKDLPNLQYINLVGTSITKEGVIQIGQLPALEKLFIYNTNISSTENKELIEQFPRIQIDMGGYIIPTYASDTTMVVD